MQIYLIKAKELHLYKIGITKNVERILNQLQTGCPYELELEKIYEPKQFTTKIEKMLHRSFACYQKNLDFSELQGEWFNLPNEIVFNFISTCEKNENQLVFLKENGNPFID